MQLKVLKNTEIIDKSARKIKKQQKENEMVAKQLKVHDLSEKRLLSE